MENFRIIQPSGVLAPYIRHYWILETDAVSSERIIPFGNVQLTFYSGAALCCQDHCWRSQAVICGQATHYADLTTTGKIRIIAVVFHSPGFRAFFPFPVNELENLKLTADEAGDRPLQELADRINETPEDSLCIRYIEQFLSKRLNPLCEYNHKRLSEAIRLINQAGNQIRIPDLAAGSCLSPRQFQRIFTDYVGLRPKDFIRVVRFQRALAMLQHSPQMSFTRLAHECDFYDQAHLIHEFKIFSGYTPREYISKCPAYSDYFSE